MMLRGLATACMLATWLTNLAAQDGARLKARDLLLYRDPSGVVRPVRSLDDWSLRRSEILAGLRQIMGEFPQPLPTRPPDVQIWEECDCGSYVRRKITYAADSGEPVPAYLCIPTAALREGTRAPAVLCLHPTDPAGNRVVVGLAERSPLAYAAELAERGYVTLAPSYPLLADYWPNLERWGYASGTLKGVWDNRCGLNLLASLPYVDARLGFGAVGHSLGGHNALFTAAWDERISVVVSSCGFDSFQDYYGGDERNWFYGRGWCQLRYMPHLSDYRGKLAEIPADFPEILAALAPRTVVIQAPEQDDNFRLASVQACVAAARPVFELWQAGDELRVDYPAGKHDFAPAERAAAYVELDRVLRGDSK